MLRRARLLPGHAEGGNGARLQDNVGLMRARVNAMQKRIEALEKELARARPAK